MLQKLLGLPINASERGADMDRPILYVNSGTILRDNSELERLIAALRPLRCRLLVSSGQNSALHVTEPDLICRPFFPAIETTRLADVVICTGGVGVCYANLAAGVPSLVLPLQPEQATNGIHLQRAGAGRVLGANQLFLGDSRVYEQAFTDGAISAAVADLLDGAVDRARLQSISRRLEDWDTRSEFLRHAEPYL